MDSSAPALENLRWYLRRLAPQTQMTLLMAFERGILRDEAIPGVEAVIAELRTQLRNSGLKPRRIGNPSRLFFQPIEPFIVDGAPVGRHHGTIARACLNPIWSWICRDLAPIEARGYVDAARRTLLGDDVATSHKLAHAFQDRVIVRIAEELDGTKAEIRTRDRLSAYMAPPRVLDDLRELACVLGARDPLARVDTSLPARIEQFEGVQLDSALALVRPLETATPGALVYAARLVMRRLDAPWQLVRLAITAAQSRSAREISTTPYDVAVTLVLADIETLLASHETAPEIRHDGEVLEPLHIAHARMDAVAAELDLTGDTPASQRYAAMRATVAKLLASGGSASDRNSEPPSGEAPALGGGSVVDIARGTEFADRPQQFAAARARPRLHSQRG